MKKRTKKILSIAIVLVILLSLATSLLVGIIGHDHDAHNYGEYPYEHDSSSNNFYLLNEQPEDNTFCEDEDHIH